MVGVEQGRRARLRRIVALGFGLLVGWTGATLSEPATAATAPLSVEITSVSVTGTGPDATVQLQALVTNVSAAPVYGARVAAWRSRDPILDLAALRQVVSSPPPGVLLTGEYQRDKITEENEPFPPGAARTVTVAATRAQLGFDTDDAAYVVGVRALGFDAGSGVYQSVGLGRTVVALQAATVPVTRLVVLSARPTKLTDNVFRNDDLAKELTGRLDALLTAAAVPGASWLIDPALLDEVTDLADGYQVRRAGELVAGDAGGVARAWLTRFAHLDRSNGARSLFANPDLAGAAAAGDPQVLSRALTAGAQVGSIHDLPLVVLPTGAVHTAELAAYLEGSGARAVIATNAARAGAWQPSTGSPVLAAQQPGSDAAFTALQRDQLAQAEAAIAGPSGQLRLIREPADIAVDAASTASWMSPRGLSELLAHSPDGPVAELLPASVPILDKAQFDGIAGLEQDFAAYGQLVPESTVTQEAAAVLTRAASTAWIADPSGFRGLLGALDNLVGPKALARAVTLDAAPRFVMSSHVNEFPVTLTNRLAETVQVLVVVDSENPQRLRVPATQLITIPPNQSQTVNIRPEASGNGVVRAEAFAATESGRRLTPPTPITIETTELGFIGWLIVLGSGAVLVLATTLRVVQVRRKGAAPPDPGPSATTAPPATAPITEPRPTAIPANAGNAEHDRWIQPEEGASHG
jgi:hypothetical protein